MPRNYTDIRHDFIFDEDMRYPKNIKWWQIALAAVIVSAIGGLSSRRSNTKERALYEKELKQPPWAPPGWVFAPAWTFNNIFLLMALNRLLRKNIPEKNNKRTEPLGIN